LVLRNKGREHRAAAKPREDVFCLLEGCGVSVKLFLMCHLFLLSFHTLFLRYTFMYAWPSHKVIMGEKGRPDTAQKISCQKAKVCPLSTGVQI
jgi:hypothetical protein